MTEKKVKLAIIGLGYVGLPLAVEFGKQQSVIGFDIKEQRIKELKSNFDSTFELTLENLQEAKFLNFTNDIEDIASCNCFIIAVPTPIDVKKNPNLKPLLDATRLVGNILKKNDIVIYESTVFPGATEEECVPELEKISGLKFNKDFYCGYSPERINPGDKKHNIRAIKKITSGSTSETAQFVDNLYKKIIVAGTYRVKSIRVAEAAKVIENTQRDLNIALINELSIIFNLLEIDTQEVLNAAASKWNFIPFNPGLVGGHCIGVDPYYLTYKAQAIGYDPQIILAGRRLNDGMGAYAAKQLINNMIKKNIKVNGANILLMGLTFKENCHDIRNSRVVDILSKLKENNCLVDVYDPWVKNQESNIEYNIIPIDIPKENYYDAIIITVGHDEFKQMGVKKIRTFGKQKHIIYDMKYVFTAEDVDMRL
jgi:UDP-N-acetyl-D-galactosamine dehydrogenase